MEAKITDDKVVCYIHDDGMVYVYIQKDNKVFRSERKSKIYDLITQTVNIGDIYSKGRLSNLNAIDFFDQRYPSAYSYKDIDSCYNGLYKYIVNEIYKENEKVIKVPIVENEYNSLINFGHTPRGLIESFGISIYDYTFYEAEVDCNFPITVCRFFEDGSVILIPECFEDYYYLTRISYIDYLQLAKFFPKRTDAYNNDQIIIITNEWNEKYN